MGKGIVTINTDAGFYPFDKVGAYAYWIKSDGVFLRGSGLFKGLCKSAKEAEFKAVINALHVLKAASLPEVKLIVFNRDNIYVQSKRNGNDMEKLLYKSLRDIFDESSPDAKLRPHHFAKFYSFRHVKAHTTKEDARSFVNRWCDAECTKQLRQWRKNKDTPAPAADAAAG